MSVHPDLVLEFARLGLVYVHLLACCVAIGLVLTSDVAMLKDLLRGGAGRAHMHEMRVLQSIVSKALIVLWFTGAAVITVDALPKGSWQYFANPKIQAKILIVVLLTLNGVLLHHRVLPWMQDAGSLMRLTFRRTLVAIFAGVVSGVSWLYAAMLGVGRPLAWKYSLVELMAAYPLLIAGGLTMMLMLALWAKHLLAERMLEFDVTVIASPRLAA